MVGDHPIPHAPPPPRTKPIQQIAHILEILPPNVERFFIKAGLNRPSLHLDPVGD